MKTLSLKQKFLRQENKKFSEEMILVKQSEWPPSITISARPPVAVWRSKGFLAQIFKADHCLAQISVCRTELDRSGKWRDGITWDDLMQIKREIGFPAAWALEILPPDSEIVNVANMRHFWIVSEAPNFAWRKQCTPTPCP